MEDPLNRLRSTILAPEAGAARLVAFDRSPLLARVLVGRSSGVEASFEFHERDGVLLGRPYRAGTRSGIAAEDGAGVEMTWTKLRD